MKCNIDSVGRMIRLLIGMLLFFAGTLMFMVSLPGATVGWRLFQLAVTLFGIFMMFEGAMGWCALRAMGVKTKF